MPVGVPQRRGGFTTICTKLVTLPYKLVHMGRCPTPRWWRCPQTPARRAYPPLDSHARIRSLVALRFFFFFLFHSS